MSSVLILEDRTARFDRLIGALLARGTVDVTRAQSAHEALELLCSRPFDAVLLDHDLDLDGARPVHTVGCGLDVVMCLDEWQQPWPAVIATTKNTAAAQALIAALVVRGIAAAWVPLPNAGNDDGAYALAAAAATASFGARFHVERRALSPCRGAAVARTEEPTP